MAHLLRTSLVLLAVCVCASTAGASPKKEKLQRDVLYQVFNDVLPVELLQALQKEGPLQMRLSESMAKFSKLSTNWYPRDGGKFHAPRFASELAVNILFDIDFPKGHPARDKIVGAEWWYQVRTSTSNIGFHYDKDESVASEQMRMLHPFLSTITYVRSTGAPTLVLNQTTPEGNGNVPLVPSVGALFFPRANKHVNFDGDLMHGVLGEMSSWNTNNKAGEERVTFLVNWWHVPAQPPNCVPVSDTDLAQYKQLTGYTIDKFPGSPAQYVPKDITPVSLEKVELGSADDKANFKFSTIVLPPEEHLRLLFPKKFANPSNHEFVWTIEQAQGGVNKLDLFDQRLMHSFWHSPYPNVIVFYSATKSTLEKIEDVILPLAQPFLQKYSFFIGEKSKMEDAMRVFGITDADLPALAIHNVKTDQKELMKKPFKAQNIKPFLSAFLKGKKPKTQKANDEL